MWLLGKESSTREEVVWGLWMKPKIGDKTNIRDEEESVCIPWNDWRWWELFLNVCLCVISSDGVNDEKVEEGDVSWMSL